MQMKTVSGLLTAFHDDYVVLSRQTFDELEARLGGGFRSTSVALASAAFTVDGRALERPRGVSWACDPEFVERKSVKTKYCIPPILQNMG